MQVIQSIGRNRVSEDDVAIPGGGVEEEAEAGAGPAALDDVGRDMVGIRCGKMGWRERIRGVLGGRDQFQPVESPLVERAAEMFVDLKLDDARWFIWL
jgi:hypothetical protein